MATRRWQQVDGSVFAVEPGTAILVTQFSRCSCGHRTYEDYHLAVQTFATELRRGEAAAISYAIGHFDREDRLIGHVRELPAQTVHLKLGDEWDIFELQQRLVEISEQCGAVWLDQLSILQTSTGICNTLAHVPAIFHTLETIMLLPGALCGCLREQIQDISNSDDFSFDLVPLKQDCCNMFGFCSHLDRI